MRKKIFGAGILVLVIAVHLAGFGASAQEIKATKQILIRFESIGRMASFQPLVQTRPKAHRLSVVRQQVVLEAPPIERHPELSENHLVVKALDVQGNEIAQVYLLDPRLIRAETTDSSGKLMTQNLYRESVEFVILLPDIPNIHSIEIFQPHWTGTEFLLESIGKIRLE